MNYIYCTECGTKVDYAYSKPKFCSNCGEGFGGLQKNTKKVKKTIKSEALNEDETEIEEVPELYNGLAVETESYGNNVFSFESLMGQEETKKSARKRSVNINDFIDGRRD